MSSSIIGDLCGGDGGVWAVVSRIGRGVQQSGDGSLDGVQEWDIGPLRADILGANTECCAGRDADWWQSRDFFGGSTECGDGDIGDIGGEGFGGGDDFRGVFLNESAEAV